MKRAVVVYVPLFVFLPTLLLLYALTEISLDISSRSSSREDLSHPSTPRALLQPPLLLDKLKAGNNKVYRKKGDDGKGVLPADPDHQGQGQGQMKGEGPKAGGKNVTFPPFVDVVNEVGAGGAAVTVNESQLSAEDKRRYDQGWQRNSFNQYVSDMISVHRPLPHGWSSHCKNKTFRSDLPEVSVIIIFHNEAWSVLLRSVHSVLSRTPSHLLREVILVDDLSTMGHLKEPLDQYWSRVDGRVKVVHSKERVGLTRARLMGYHLSTAPMLVFFDSHIECFPGWFEPLADRIASEPNVTVFPSIETIDQKTLRVDLNHNVGVLGVFRWRDLTFTWGVPTDQQQALRKSPADPIKSPTMPGGLFAISRDFFTRLGQYDPGLQYWGGENIELSFKAWMCYGSVELVPCSHVGHIFRFSNPIKWKTDLGLTNVARVAHVWMDDYKNYFLERNLFKVGDYGDISDRQKLREKLQCRNFDWFVHNVHPVAFVPQHVQHAGELKTDIEGTERCIDSYGPSSTIPRVIACHGQGGNQFWYISEDGEVFQDEKQICGENKTVTLSQHCHHKWNITSSHQLMHVTSGQCLQAGGQTADQAGHSDSTLTLQTCDLDNQRQRWQTKPRDKNIRFPSF